MWSQKADKENMFYKSKKYLSKLLVLLFLNRSIFFISNIFQICYLVICVSTLKILNFWWNVIFDKLFENNFWQTYINLQSSNNLTGTCISISRDIYCLINLKADIFENTDCFSHPRVSYDHLKGINERDRTRRWGLAFIPSNGVLIDRRDTEQARKW